MPTLKMSQKQATAWTLLDDPTVTELTLGGGAGGGKSIFSTEWAVAECRRYPGVRIGIGRKELKRLKETTLVTLLQKTHPLLGVTDGDYNYNDQKGKITYRNGSAILLVDLAWQPSDPDYDTLGSLELTHAIIEEVGEIRKKAYDVFGSRINRHLNTEYGITGKLISTTNPTENFLREEAYDVYERLGGGAFQKWPHGEVEINGQIVQAYRAFVKSLVTDNPFVDANYRLQLRKLPPAERKRLLEGNWNYSSNDRQLFPMHLMISRKTDAFPLEGRQFLGVDIADEGNDDTKFAHTKNGVLIRKFTFKIPKGVREPVSHLIGAEVIRYCQQEGIPPINVAIDAVGVGVGVRDYLRSKGFGVQEYIGGAGVKGAYRNLRAASFWDLHDRIENNEAKIFADVEDITEMLRQLRAIEYFTEEGVTKITPKKDLKELLQRSPDDADAWNMANWAEHGDMDKRYDASRIGVGARPKPPPEEAKA